MRDILAASRGLIVAEAILMALTPVRAGRPRMIWSMPDGRETADIGKSLLEVLAKVEDVATPLGLEQRRKSTDSAHYLGAGGDGRSVVIG